MKEVLLADFYFFDHLRSGQVVTSCEDYVVVYARNPYGTHNLMVCEKEYVGYNHVEHRPITVWDAQYWGDSTVLKGLKKNPKRYRRALRFLVTRGKNPFEPRRV